MKIQPKKLIVFRGGSTLSPSKVYNATVSDCGRFFNVSGRNVVFTTSKRSCKVISE